MPGNTLDVGARPTPDRIRLATAIRSSGSLQLVAEGVAAAIEFIPLLVYVERQGKRYRWSPAHRGGPYPLMRVTARFLGIDHSALFLPFRALNNGDSAGFGKDGFWEGVCIVRGAEDDSGPPDAWALLEFDAPENAKTVKTRIRQALDESREKTDAID